MGSKLYFLIILLALAALFPIFSLGAAICFFLLIWATAYLSFDWRFGNFLLFNFEVFLLFKVLQILFFSDSWVNICQSGVSLICGIEISSLFGFIFGSLIWLFSLIILHGLILIFARKLKDKFDSAAVFVLVFSILPLIFLIISIL